MRDATDGNIDLFISYSRQDSAFVDKLDADLQQRGFNPWVDRDHLEGSDIWQSRLESAIRQSIGVLVVIPPQGVELEWVRREIQCARDFARTIIPLRTRDFGNAQIISLNLEQYVDFADSYDAGIEALLTAIYHRLMLPSPDSDEQDVVAVGDAARPLQEPQPLDPRLARLYGEAQATDDLERRNRLYEQILVAKPDFAHNLVVLEHEQLQPQLRAKRLADAVQAAHSYESAADWRRASGAWQVALQEDPNLDEARAGLLRSLQSVAEDAYEHGSWNEEIGAWEAILNIAPDDSTAAERLPIALTNLDLAPDYKTAVQLSRESNREAAKHVLEHVWQQAPFFGDPDEIASGLGLPLPPSLREVTAAELLRQEHERQQRQADDARRRIQAMQPQVTMERVRVVTHRPSGFRGMFRHWPKLSAPDLLIPRRDLCVGEPFIIEYRMPVTDTLLIKRVLLELIAVEEVKCYKEVERRVYDEDGSHKEITREHKTLRASRVWERYVHEGGKFRKGSSLSREQQMQIPATAMHTLKSESAALGWYIRVTVELERRLGSIAGVYSIVVLPRRYS